MERFDAVLFVPGNHDLWVLGDTLYKASLQKFVDVTHVAQESGASMEPFFKRGLFIVPLLGWYD